MTHFRWALPFVFALLFWASFHPLNLGFLGWVALVPLLVYAKVTSGRKSFFVAWLAGWLAFTACFIWVRYTVPAAPYLLGFYQGLYVALFVVLVRRLGVIWTPALWTGLEYVRGTLFGGLPWFLLGYTQHDSFHLIQIADLGGVWLVSALVAMVNAAILDGRRAPRWVAAGALVASFAYGAVRVETIAMSEGPRVAIIQPNLPQDLKKNALLEAHPALETYRKHLALTLRVARERPDLILWPEAAVYFGLEWDPAAKKWVRDSWYRRVVAPSEDTGTRTLIGLLVLERGPEPPVAYTNSAVYVDPRGQIAGRYDKVHLVPFAEYTPLASTFPWIRDLRNRFSHLQLADMRPGAEFPLWEVGGYRFGTQICFEAIFPEISREIARKGASFTVNISNDGWFRDSAELDQMLAMARFRAIENRTQLIRATNTGISAFIEPTGRLQAMICDGDRAKGVEGTLTARVKVTGSTSLYRGLGNWVAWLAAVAGAAGIVRFIFVDRKKKNE